jgi:2-polyprenyl-3-methyl-5-hydroxy-6-metoxy-1,4-benzoquinol methylase
MTMADDQIEVLSAAAPFSMADAWYEFAAPDHFWFQWRFDALQGLLRSADLGEKILEIGCGNCVARNQLEKWLARPIVGCDLNLSSLRLAAPGSGSLYIYDIHDRRPQWQDFFDTVFLLDTLEHIGDTDKFLASVRYHLRPGGQLVINVPSLPSLYGKYDIAAGHVKRYTIAVLREELERAGFHIERHQYWGFTLMPVLAARTLLQRRASGQDVIAKGIKPSSRLADKFLRSLMWTERNILPRPWIGTSLAAIARRVDG